MRLGLVKVVIVVLLSTLASLAGAQEPEKFSLSMFHFNVQYVAGGLEGYPSGTDNRDVYDLDDAEMQDLIIVESFEPILDLFLAHSTWKVTLEMQAYMVELLIERHPGILTKLKQLVDNGQAELVSFHWSDQLFLAYPRRDMEVSHEIMDAVWERAGLTPSGTVFCQEGQFGEGMAPFAAAHQRDILVLPKNLFRYQHLADYDNAPPLFDLNGVDVVIGSRSFATSEVEVNWNFFDDGELLATGGMAPYMGKDFKHSPEAMALYEQELLAAEADGARIATISEYVDWAKENGLEQAPLPPILDGTWQPPSTDSMHRWMGAAGLIDMAYGGERDNEVLTGNVQARHWVAAAETLVTRAEQLGWTESGQFDERLEECWRYALLGQVSDASGINPFVGETLYGFEQAAAAAGCAHEILLEVAPEAGGPFVMIDTGSGEVLTSSDMPAEVAREKEPLFSEDDGFRIEADGRQVDLSWQEASLEGGVTRLTISVSQPDDGQRRLRVEFPHQLDEFILTPGLLENEVRSYPFADFDFMEGRITLPLANGLIGLDEDLWLIKQTSLVHIGATFDMGSGVVAFEEQTLDPQSGATWVFWIVEGSSADALALANRLNLHPVIWVETGVDGGRGCGCGAGAQQGLGLYLMLLGLLVLRRFRAGVGLNL